MGNIYNIARDIDFINDLKQQLKETELRRATILNALLNEQACPDGFGCSEWIIGDNPKLCATCWRKYLDQINLV